MMITWTRVATASVVLGALVSGCGTRPHVPLPTRLSGQIPVDYHLQEGRGVVLARISVSTQGQPGFGAITNPLVLQFQSGDQQDGAARTVTLADPNTYVFGTPSEKPSVWRYDESGLLAMSIAPGIYDGLAIAYPDFGHQAATPESIPVPSSAFVFAPVSTQPGTIVYLGDIEIQQGYSFSDRLLDRVDVSYAVRDNYDGTVADFRARYPQFAEIPVERRVVGSVDQ